MRIVCPNCGRLNMADVPSFQATVIGCMSCGSGWFLFWAPATRATAPEPKAGPPTDADHDAQAARFALLELD